MQPQLGLSLATSPWGQAVDELRALCQSLDWSAPLGWNAP